MAVTPLAISRSPAGGIPLPDDPVPVNKATRRARLGRTSRALIRLARSHRRLDHRPTLMQVRALAHFDGREPSSARPTGERAAELPLVVGTRSAARAALHRWGRRVELVTLPDGGAFDLLDIGG